MDIHIAAEAIISKANEIIESLGVVAGQVKGIRAVAGNMLGGGSADANAFFVCVTVFVLACIIGYFVVWNVTPALHSPLMAVTNAISSVIIVGAIMILGEGGVSLSAEILAFIAIGLASINIFGGFTVTQRMLQMFKRKSEKKTGRSRS
jgi:NAD(P) transhydrogenase subunit alpha